MLLELFQVPRRLEQEHAGVPIEVTTLHIARGGSRIGLFDELGNLETTVRYRLGALDVAEAGFGRFRANSKRYQPVLARKRNGTLHGIHETGLVADQMVCGKNKEYGVRID